MTAAGLLTLVELAAESGVPTPRLRHYAEAGLLPPARRDSDLLGYPPAEVGTARLLAGAEDLGLDGDTLTALAGAWRDEACTTARRELADAVSARIGLVQAAIGEQNRQALEAGPGTSGRATVIGGSASLSENAGRLQAVAAALTATAHDGPCGDGCGCAIALAAAGTVYHFRTTPRTVRRRCRVTWSPTAATCTIGSACGSRSLAVSSAVTRCATRTPG